MPKSEAQKRYEKRTAVNVSVTLNRNTDADILAKLAEQGNRTAYIKRLIREDMARG